MLGRQPRPLLQLHDEVVVDEILTRLPPGDAVRCRAVCRAWNAALTSERFLLAHRARSAAARQPELLFSVPAAGGGTSLYTCTLRGDGSAARELLTLAGAEHVEVMSPRPCHGLTLILDAQAAAAAAASSEQCCYYVCNLSTGEHVALPPCERQAATVQPPIPPMRIGMAGNNCLRFPPWSPLELSSTGLGAATGGEHKVVRLFKSHPTGETSCDVCTREEAGGRWRWRWRWRPCAGRVPPPAAGFVACLPPVSLGGSLCWLLANNNQQQQQQQQPIIMSLSVGAEQFGWVHMPPLLARRIGHLTDLDGSLCAVADLRFDAERYALFTWTGTGTSSSSWSMRCSINLQSLPPAISDEFVDEQLVIPLCTAAGKLLLSTGRHKVFAYDPERLTMERVFYAREFVHVPRDARLLLNVGLHEESIATVHQHGGGNSRLQVKMGTTVVARRKVPHDEYRDRHFSRLRDLFNDLAAGLPLNAATNC
ncbi:unnamed protein product [Urochloa decumbens]|uniref:F-box domain-containing protein n=1 Tax=Urochloa decumbens TaxID=240449 RepID=A0ABC9B7B5_9POAL